MNANADYVSGPPSNRFARARPDTPDLQFAGAAQMSRSDRDRLDRDRVAAAGLTIVDTQGAAGFTIRAVAEALGVTPMALYRHVRDKVELVSLVVDAANRHQPLPTPTDDWRADIMAMAQWNRDGALAHPGIRELWRMHPVYTPELSRISDQWISIWMRSGLSRETATMAAIISNTAINGLISEEEVYRGVQPPDEATLARLPNLRLALSVLPNPDEMFELLVGILIDGIHRKLLQDRDSKSQPAKPARTRAKRKR